MILIRWIFWINNTEYFSYYIYYVNQSNKYMTLQEIAEILDVSRKTILNDMKKIKSYINKYSVNIDSKSLNYREMKFG